MTDRIKPNVYSSINPVAPPSAVLGLSVGVSVMGLVILIPALPLIKNDFGATSTAVQLLLTGYLISLAIGQLVFGTISDRYGRRPVLITGAGLFMIGGFISLFCQSIEELTVCRIIQGAGAAACQSMGRAIVSDCFNKEKSAKAMSTVQTIQAVTPIFTLILGGSVAEYVGWEGAMIFIAFMGFLVFILGLIFVKETNFNSMNSLNLVDLSSSYYYVMKNKIFLSFAMSCGLQAGMFLSLNSVLPFYYEKIGVSAFEFGLWFSLTPLFFFIGNICNRLYFIDRGIESASMQGCVLSFIAICLLVIVQLLGIQSPLGIAIPCCLFGFSNGIVTSNSIIGALKSVSNNSGIASGLVGAWQMAAGGIAGYIIIEIGGGDIFINVGMVLLSMSFLSVVSIFYVFKKSKI